MKINELRFGTAGIPWAAKGLGTQEGVKKVRELGLDAMELEFVHNVNVSLEKAPEIKQVAKQNNIVLTCHCPYYINLNSSDPQKIVDSVGRIMKSASILEACGGWSACMHAAFYGDVSPGILNEKLKNIFSGIVKSLKNESIEVWIRPEIGGKKTQFGPLEEIVALCKSVEQMLPCVDYAHFHARDGGNKKYEHFEASLSLIEKELGKDAIQNMHMHVEGIAYNGKGEKNHLNLDESDFQWQELLRALKEFNAKGVLICESPNIEKDAMMMQEFYGNIYS
ncbi:MAG: TIM barrel protein [Candidatus Aenigmarchaeota archaeon]|nr:TIM barrel protein [Candidatus Aenigmarchaeota archaeon]